MQKLTLVFTLLIAGYALRAQPDANRQGQLEIIAEPEVEQLQKLYIAQNRSSSSLMGYRVQIYNGRKSETLKKRSEFLSVFPDMEPYTVYDSPEYKLQAGDFRTRLEAEKFLKQVVEEFGSGFVVKTKIKWPRLEYDMPEEKR